MDVEYKIPTESASYTEWSQFVTARIGAIIKAAIDRRDNLIYIRTNLRRGLPLENINKVDGPFVEAWAVEQFDRVAEQNGNAFELVHVEAGTRTGMADVILQFKRQPADSGTPANYVSADVDVKATAQDIPKSGKSPNITSFERVRSAYIKDADYLFRNYLKNLFRVTDTVFVSKTNSKNKNTLPTIWRIPDGLWPLVERVLTIYDPPSKRGRPRMNPRQALDGIIYRMRTGCQWNQLPQEFGDDASIHRTMQRWEALGIFDILWAVLISKCDDLRAVEWDWQAADGAMGKARGIPKRGRRTRSKNGMTPRNVSDGTPPTEGKQASRKAYLSKEAAARLLYV